MYLSRDSRRRVESAGHGLAALPQAFRKEYTTTYGGTPDDDLELVNLRLIATGAR